MYFVYGPENYLIDQFVNKIVNENNDKEIVPLDLDNYKAVNEIFSEISNHSLFDKSKVYLIKNLVYFEKNNIVKNENDNVSELLRILKNDHTNVFVFINNKIESKDKIANNNFTKVFFNELSQIQMFFANKITEKEVYVYAKKICAKYGLNIVNESLNLLTYKTKNNIEYLEKEIFKLSNYKKPINPEIIESLVEDLNKEDDFAFINSLESNDFNLIWTKYIEKMNSGSEILSLMGQLSQTLILANQIYAYKKANKSIDDFVNELNINSYRAKKVFYILNKLGQIKIKKMLLSLAHLDRNIKLGKVEEKKGFEKFLFTFFY